MYYCEPSRHLRGTSRPRTCVDRRRRDTRLSHGHVGGVAAAWLHEDAIGAKLKFRKPQKRTLSQHRRDGKIPIIIAARFSGEAAKAGWSNAVASKIRRAQGAFARPLRFVE